MVDDDPFTAPVKKPLSLQAQLDNASIGDLEDRIENLRAEIALCERAIAAKRAHAHDDHEQIQHLHGILNNMENARIYLRAHQNRDR